MDSRVGGVEESDLKSYNGSYIEITHERDKKEDPLEFFTIQIEEAYTLHAKLWELLKLI